MISMLVSYPKRIMAQTQLKLRESQITEKNKKLSPKTKNTAQVKN